MESTLVPSLISFILLPGCHRVNRFPCRLSTVMYCLVLAHRAVGLISCIMKPQKSRARIKVFYLKFVFKYFIMLMGRILMCTHTLWTNAFCLCFTLVLLHWEGRVPNLQTILYIPEMKISKFQFWGVIVFLWDESCLIYQSSPFYCTYYK